MKHLQQDLIIIRNIPDVIVDRIVRINVSDVKSKIISTIKSNISKIIKASEDVLQRLLSIGQIETDRAKRLNDIVAYTTIGEYVKFAKALSNRGVEKSINKVAMNSVVLQENWEFLESNNHQVKHKMMGQYLESCIWVKMLRQAANANKVKLVVDPTIFTEGIGAKKQKVYQKYAGILK